MARAWRKDDGQPRKTVRERGRDRWRRIRLAVVAFLGGKCVRCGFSDPRALQIDHVNGGGCRELREMKGNRSLLRYRIFAHPEEYQLLCANCNAIKKHDNGEVRRG